MTAEEKKEEQKQARAHLDRQIAHEESLINSRMTWMLTIQGFLFAALALLVKDFVNPSDASNTHLMNITMIKSIPVLGAVIALFSFLGIIAAYISIDHHRSTTKIKKYRPGGNATASVLGRIVSISIPGIIALTWAYIFWQFSLQDGPEGIEAERLIYTLAITLVAIMVYVSFCAVSSMKTSRPNNSLTPPIILGNESNSFASFTLKNRFPHIIQKVIIDNEPDAIAVNQLKRLNDEISTKTIKRLSNNKSEDRTLWANYVQPYLGKKWPDAPFFFVEMYFYRRILEALSYFDLDSESPIDPYKKIKDKELRASDSQVQEYALALKSAKTASCNNLEDLTFFITSSIWSNRADLSQLPSNLNGDTEIISSAVNPLLINDLPIFSDFIKNKETLDRVDVILDNSGAELLADLALTTYLLESGIAKSVFLHCKASPVFVSDATLADVNITVDYMQNSQLPHVKSWVKNLLLFIEQGRLVLCCHNFWTLPLFFREFPDDLSLDLKLSNLVIVKGDANYRRLVEDRHWSISTRLKHTVDYFPTNFIALRVLKSELLVGANLDHLASFNLPKDWMVNGKYGIAQFFERPLT